jgi:hypothetical protein
MVLLLTSSSISVLISSVIVFLFTFFLFLSGYILQQQTVRNLQLALHPTVTPTVKVLPVYPASFTEGGRRGNGTELAHLEGDAVGRVADKGYKAGKMVAIEFGSSKLLEGGGQSSLAASDGSTSNPSATITMPLPPPEADANRLEDKERYKDLTYVQLLEKPCDICSSLLFFQALQKQGSKVPGRVVMYPSYWATRPTLSSDKISNMTAPAERSKEEDAGANALKILRAAAATLSITLRPVEVPVDGSRGKSLLLEGFNLTNYTRILYVRNGGFLLNASNLDAALLASKKIYLDAGMAAVGTNDEIANLSLFLLRPSKEVRDEVKKELERDEMEMKTVDEAVANLVTRTKIEVTRLELRETTDGDGKRVLVGKKVTTARSPADKEERRRQTESSYLHFSRQEVDKGVVMEDRSGMWWDGLMKYRKGVAEVCKNVDFGEASGERRGGERGGGGSAD